MTTDDKIIDEMLQYDINREQQKYQLYHLKKIDKYEYLTGEEISLSNQRQIKE